MIKYHLASERSDTQRVRFNLCQIILLKIWDLKRDLYRVTIVETIFDYTKFPKISQFLGGNLISRFGVCDPSLASTMHWCVQ